MRRIKASMIVFLLFVSMPMLNSQNVKFNLTEMVDINETRSTIEGVTATLKNNQFEMFVGKTKFLDLTLSDMRRKTTYLSGEYSKTFDGIGMSPTGSYLSIIIQLKTVSKKCNIVIIETTDNSTLPYYYFGTYRE